MKDYYKILGLDKSATDADIKKQFRKLSLENHPDRQVGKSDAEKKAAEERFKDIAEAYEVLKDPKKRQQYDAGGSGGFGDFDDFFSKMNGGGFDPFMGHTDPFDFSDLFGTRRRRQSRPYENPEDLRGTDIRMNIPLSVEDIVNGCKKKVKYKRHVRCHVCHGKGGENKVTCPYCHGTGMETKVMWRSGMRFESSTTCTHCNGKGYKMENPCSNCHETGFEIVEETLTIAFQPGIGTSPTMYAQKGNESRSENGASGNFIAVPVIDTTKLNSKYKIDGINIYETIKVKMTDALLGKEIELQVPGQEKYKQKLSTNTKPGDTITRYGLGLLSEDFEYNRTKRGNYVFVIEYEVPSSLTQEQKDLLEKLSKTGI